MNNKISVVIAAYNEEPRIANVLKVVQHHPLINEVIVVNDGSSDKTSDIVRQFDVTLIENEKNLGKTLSIKKGIEAAKNDLIMLLDADLIGLSPESISELAKPVLGGKVDWSLSLRSNSFGRINRYKFAKVDWLSGERVVPKDLLADPLIWSRPNVGYGVETLMNRSLLHKRKTFQSVYLPGVVNPTKSDKNGAWGGFIKQSKMVLQILKIVPPYEAIGQLIRMSYLNNKYTKL